MESNERILLRTLLRSTSNFNILRFETDKKKRGNIVGNFVGIIILYILLFAFAVLTGMGLGMAGLTSSIPLMGAMLIIIMEFIFTLFKTNGYLFAFKEYDMLMAMPFKVKSVVSCKFLYMYIKNLPLTICISLSLMVAYGMYAKPDVITYIIWVILTFLLPLIPMVIASALGTLIAKAGSKSRHKNLVQTILTFVLIVAAFGARYIIEGIFKNNQVNSVMNDIAGVMDSIKSILLPAAWFEGAVVSHKISDILLLVGCSILIYEVFFTLVAKNYRQINTNLMSGAAGKKYKMTKQKSRSVKKSIAYKEFRHFMNSTPYITNLGIGEILVAILCLLLIFIDVDKIISTVTSGSGLTKDHLIPGIPLVIYFLTGMCSTTAISLSLEGKNYWILQSLPIEKKDIIQGKMLFNMYLTVPFMVLGTICLSIACGASPIHVFLFLILGFVLCAFSSAYGMHCDLKHTRLEWENEIEVIKQGSSTAYYMFPNMIGTLLLLIIVIILGGFFGIIPITLILTAFAALLTLLSYLGCLKLVKKM